MNHERGGDRKEHSEQQAIEKLLVVGDDERTFVPEDGCVAVYADPEQQAQQPAQKGPHDARAGRRLHSVLGIGWGIAVLAQRRHARNSGVLQSVTRSRNMLRVQPE